MLKRYLKTHFIFSLTDNPAQDRPQPLRQGLQRHGRRSKVAEKVSLPPLPPLVPLSPLFCHLPRRQGEEHDLPVFSLFPSLSFLGNPALRHFPGWRAECRRRLLLPPPPPIRAPKNLSLTLRRIDVRDRRRRRLSPPPLSACLEISPSSPPSPPPPKKLSPASSRMPPRPMRTEP